MMRSRLLTIVAVIGFVAPITGIAQSYMTPEQVLQQNDGAFLMPTHHRGAVAQANLEAQLSMDRHPSVIHEPWDPVQDNGLPPPVALDQPTDVQPVTQQQPTGYSNLDPLTARLLARLAQQNSILASTAAANGAPLAGSGPAATLSVIAMVGAGLWTLRKARLLERFIREA